jgi:hypothetical protein
MPVTTKTEHYPSVGDNNHSCDVSTIRNKDTWEVIRYTAKNLTCHGVQKGESQYSESLT